MTPHSREATDENLEAELDRLTYSAYLLTLDPGLALSVVMIALDASLDEVTTDSDLLGRTVELSLWQLRREPNSAGDRECTPFEAGLYGDYKAAPSSRILRLGEDQSSNPILALDSGSRIAFVLHHVLGYRVKKAAHMAQMSEEAFRGCLRNAYVQLTSRQFGPHALAGAVLGDYAQA